MTSRCRIFTRPVRSPITEIVIQVGADNDTILKSSNYSDSITSIPLSRRRPP
jgi:hypothetical protein